MPLINLRELGKVGGNLATIGGAAVAGYGEDKADALKEALQQTVAERQARKDAIDADLSAANKRHLNAESDALLAPKPHEYRVENGQRIDLTDNTATPVTGYTAPPKPHTRTVENGQVIDVDAATSTPVAGYTPPKKDPALITAPDPKDPGKLIRVPDVAGQEVPSPGGSAGGAAIKKALATNATQLSVIDDALKELDAHPQAVGLTRAAGDIPVIGGLIGDPLNQRLDPQGVAARASLANIGSLKVHDRSGGAVTVSEYPRLAPFIPKVSDTIEAIRTKLQKLREGIQTETDALRGGADGNAPIDHTQLSDEEFARQYKAGAFHRPP